jgi:hypothetical protein
MRFSKVFLDAAPCSLIDTDRRFGGASHQDNEFNRSVVQLDRKADAALGISDDRLNIVV